MTTTIRETGPGKPLFSPLLVRRMLAFAIVGLVVIGTFVIGAGEGNPAWGKYWRIKPILLTPALCAMVGLCYDLTAPLRRMPGWKGKVFFVLSILGAMAGMWMSLILGLAGTMWD